MKLGVNIDHIATLRQARRELFPDPIAAASICELSGADSIVCHLRQDRRHIHDKDILRLRESVKTRLNLEMSIVDEIVKIATLHGVEAPFLRPSELSDDHTPTAPVLLHALDFFKKMGVAVDYICCIYPTAVFIQPKYLLEGHRSITENRVSSVFSVTSYSFPIFRALKINQKGHLEMFWPENEMTRSQDLPEAYHDAGQFYWLDAGKFKKSGKIYDEDSMPVILPRYLVQDIDTPEDWEVAERLYRSLNQNNK